MRLMDKPSYTRDIVRPPSPVTFAVGLIIVGLIASLVSVSLNIVFAPRQHSRSVIIVVSVAMISLQVGLAYFLFIGRNWARVIYIASGLLAVAMGIKGPNPAGVHHEFVVINHWLGLAIIVVTTILFLLPPSNAWYKAYGLAHKPLSVDHAQDRRDPSSRPASVITAIVILSLLSLSVLFSVYTSIVSAAYAQLIGCIAFLVILLVPIFGLLTRRSWSRIYSAVLFALLALLMIVGNTFNSVGTQRVVALSYSIVIACLLSWLIVSLLRKRVRAHFSI
jgi:MFS family permease